MFRKLLLFVVLLLSGMMVAAQDAPAETAAESFPVAVTITGTVEALGANTVTIDGVIYWFSEAVDLSVFVVGQPVSLTAVLSSTVQITIITINPVAAPQPEATPEAEATPEPVPSGQHPVALAIAEAFDVPYAEIIGWSQHSIGFGEIARAYLLADLAGADVTTILGLRIAGVGWGEIVGEYDVAPSQLAPGRILSGRFVRSGVNLPEDVATDGTLTGQPAPTPLPGSDPAAPGATPAPGSDGLNRFGCEDRGNSCNAPGQQNR
jgi:hypothetical protein